MKSQAKSDSPTTDRLQESLITLCEEQDYYSISVGQICENAGVNRSTFYLNFSNKDDLLRSVEKHYIRHLEDELSDFRKNRPAFTPEEYPAFRDALVIVMKYHYAHRKLCCFLLSPSGDPYFGRLLRDRIRRVNETSVRHDGRPAKVNQKYGSNFFYSGYVSVLYEWLSHDDRTPEEMADFLMKILDVFAKKLH